MLAARNRLTTPGDFRDVVRRGRRAGGHLLVVHSLTAPGADLAPRAGFVVSKAVGNAVTRNLVKRRLRHLVRERLDALPAAGLLVVRAQPGAAAASYAELGGELDRCLSRVAGSAGRPGTRDSVEARR